MFVRKNFLKPKNCNVKICAFEKTLNNIIFPYLQTLFQNISRIRGKTINLIKNFLMKLQEYF